MEKRVLRRTPAEGTGSEKYIGVHADNYVRAYREM